MPGIGRFASADSLVPDPANPQSLNRYTYVLNSPLVAIDPTGHISCTDSHLPGDDQQGCITSSYAHQVCLGWELDICGDWSHYPSNSVVNALANIAYNEIVAVEEVEDYPDLNILRQHIVMLLLASADQNLSQDEIAYILATAFSESRLGVMDYGLIENRTDADAEETYGYRSLVGPSQLGNIYPGDGAKYKGRGFVQLTGRWQYETIDSMLGTNLVNNPELAADPRFAAIIAAQGMKEGWFTTSNSNDVYNFHRYTDTNGNLDFLNARYIIHGYGYNKYTVRNRTFWFLPVLAAYRYP